MTEEGKAPAATPYKLVTVDSNTNLDQCVTASMSIEQMRLHILSLCGHQDVFHVLKIPEEGTPVERVCATTEELAAAISELTAGEKGTLFVYRGEKVKIGHQRTVIPLSIDTEEILSVPVSQPDPPEDDSPAEAAPAEAVDEPEQPAKDPPAEG